MAKTLANGSLGNYELRAAADGMTVKLQQRELGAARFVTKATVSVAAWERAAALHSDASGAFFDLGMPRQ